MCACKSSDSDIDCMMLILYSLCRLFAAVQRLVFELFLLIARHGVTAQDFKLLFNLFDSQQSPVVCCCPVYSHIG